MWDKLVRGLESFRVALPESMRDTLDTKGDEIIEWLGEDQPDLKDAYVKVGPKKRGTEYELEIRVKPEYSQSVKDLEFGVPGRGGMGPKPITFYTPEEIMRVLEELQVERSAWEAGGRIGPNPFTKEAEEKLIREGKIIRRGPIAGRPPTRYVERAISLRLPIIKENFAKEIRRLWGKSMRGLK